MVININLLPPAERQPRWLLTRIIILSSTIIIAIVITFAILQSYTIWKLERDVAAAQQRYSLLNNTRQMMLKATKQNQLTTAKMSLLVKLTDERKPCHAILGRLGVITPRPIWLTELIIDEKAVLRITGNAVTHQDLVSFLQLFEQDELLTAPQLTKVEQDATSAITRFEMTVKVNGIKP